MSAKRPRVSPDDEEPKYLADSYRLAAWDLLHAARRLETITALLAHTKVRVSRAAILDIREARGKLRTLPDVRSMTTLEKV